MYIAYTADERELQREIAAYLGSIMTPELVRAFAAADFPRGMYRDVLQRVGADGWLSRAWPTEFGGQGRDAVEQYIFFNEARKASLPLPYLTVTSVAPALMRYGSAEHKRDLVPAVGRGETLFGIGYSEAEAGTDLASMTSSAVRDGDEYVINGQKLWTSLAHLADHIWLAVRTSNDEGARKHAGLSIFVVPIDTPGVALTPIETIGDYRTNATYFEDVRVPASARVGEEGQGWEIITGQLDFERVALSNPGYVEAQLREVHRWARAVRPDGTTPVDRPHVRRALAEAYAIHESLKLLNWRLAAAIRDGKVTPADASTVKVFGTEGCLDAFAMLMDALGEDGYVKAWSEASVIDSDLEKAYRRDLTFTFGGGANEVQRQIIARDRLSQAR